MESRIVRDQGDTDLNDAIVDHILSFYVTEQ